VISDHINLQGVNPLTVRTTRDRLRFPRHDSAYDRRFVNGPSAKETHGIGTLRGVRGLSGRAMRPRGDTLFAGDRRRSVGMSTVPEVIGRAA